MSLPRALGRTSTWHLRASAQFDVCWHLVLPGFTVQPTRLPERPVKGETNALVVITDLCLERSDTGKLGRKRPIRSGASEMAGRNIKRTLQLRNGMDGLMTICHDARKG